MQKNWRSATHRQLRIFFPISGVQGSPLLDQHLLSCYSCRLLCAYYTNFYPHAHLGNHPAAHVLSLWSPRRFGITDSTLQNHLPSENSSRYDRLLNIHYNKKPDWMKQSNSSVVHCLSRRFEVVTNSPSHLPRRTIGSFFYSCCKYSTDPPWLT